MSKELISIGLTDTHLTRGTLSDNESIFDQAIELAVKHGLKEIHHYGDIFTNRAGQSLDILITFSRIIKKFEKSGIILKAMPGNHDKVHLNAEASYLDLFHSQYFQVIDGPHKQTITEEIDYFYLPYFKEADLYPQLLKRLSLDVNKKKTNYLFTHIAVKGVKNNDGTEVDNSLNNKSFSAFDKVFIGHYHNRSKVGDKIHHVGSAFPQNFGEDNEKGFLLVYDDGSHDYHRPVFREYHKIDLSVDQIDEFLSTGDYKSKIESGHQVRVVISGEDSKINSFDKTKISNHGISVKLKGDKIEENIKEAEENTFVSFSHDSVTQAYKKFCEEKGYEVEEGLVYLKKLENVRS